MALIDKENIDLPAKGEEAAIGNICPARDAESDGLTEGQQRIKRRQRNRQRQLLQQIGHGSLPFVADIYNWQNGYYQL